MRVYVRPTAYLKPGDLEIKLHNVTFGKNDGTGTTQEWVSLSGVSASNQSTFSVKVSATNQFSTIVLPFDVEEMPVGLSAYSCHATEGERLVLTKQNTIKSFTPYILYAENGFESTLTGEVDATKYQTTVTDGYLTGTIVSQEISGGAGYYVMQNKGDGPMFYKVGDTSSFSIQPGKCWLTLPSDLQGTVAFCFGDLTGIERIESSSSPFGLYDLSGRRLREAIQRGVYIIDGKKFIK